MPFISNLNAEKPFLNASSLVLAGEKARSENMLVQNTPLKNSLLKNMEPCNPSHIQRPTFPVKDLIACMAMGAATAGSYHLMLKSRGEDEIDLNVSVGVALLASAAGYTLGYFGAMR